MPASSVSAAAVRLHLTDDVEAHAGARPRWRLRYDQTSRGRFEGRLDELQLEGIQVIRDRSNQAMVKNGEAWPGAILFSLPLRGADMAMYCEGHRHCQPRLLVAPATDLPELHTPAGLELMCVAIDQALLQRQLERQNCRHRLGERAHCQPLAGSKQEWLAASQDLFDTAALPPALAGHPAVRQGVRDALLQRLLDQLDHDAVAALRPSARKRMVDRARDYALARSDRPPSVLELCNHVGASRRKLQYCFQESMGTNPVAYLRMLRLNQVRRALCSENAGLSVLDIAAVWGFWHPSRFAAEYRQLFGQSPSETRRQALGRLPELFAAVQAAPFPPQEKALRRDG